MRTTKGLLAASLAVAALAGCASTPSSSEQLPAQRSITVFAASSLMELFKELAAQYETAHPGVTVTLSFGSSTTLALQIAEGAPANVFASASTKAMKAAGSRITDPHAYVSNHVVVAYPATTGAATGTGAGILNSVKTWIQCAHEAPCGAVADKAISAFGVTSAPASLEPDVKSVVTKLAGGEADAGIVYITDAKAAGLAFAEFGDYGAGSAEATALTTQYMIGQVDAGDADAASFVQFVLSSTSLGMATDLGFTPPA